MRTVIILAVLLAMPAMAFSATYYVPGDYPTIQLAIDSVVNGDTVIVERGTYYENIVFISKDIDLLSQEGPDVTIIDGSNAGTVVTFLSANSKLDGFTITHGNGYGGGICIEDASPKILNNLITGNIGTDRGGGIYIGKYSSPHISSNVFLWNKADYGGAIFGYFCTPVITNNFFTHNKCMYNGGGLNFEYICKVILTNNTIYHNYTGSSSACGGGIYCREGCYLQITNEILWENTSALGPEIYVANSSNPSTVTIDYSDVMGGAASVVVEPGCTLNWGLNMISVFPDFVDAGNNDFHIVYNSPCMDAGSNTAPALPSEDFEGDPRIAYQLPDMGADEFHRHLYYTGNATPGGTVSMKFVGHPGTLQVGLIIGANLLNPPLWSAWGWLYINPLSWIIISPLPAIPANGVLTLSAPLPMAPPAPYTIHFQALIGWQFTNLCTMHVQ